jgi:hypothetical protein
MDISMAVPRLNGLGEDDEPYAAMRKITNGEVRRIISRVININTSKVCHD